MKDYTKEQLEEMLHSKKPRLRAKVAHAGYGLDLLMSDKSLRVRNEALLYLVAKRKSLKSWIAENPEKCALLENRKTALSENNFKSAPVEATPLKPFESLMEQIAQANEKRVEPFGTREQLVAKAKEQADRIKNVSR